VRLGRGSGSHAAPRRHSNRHRSAQARHWPKSEVRGSRHAEPRWLKSGTSSGGREIPLGRVALRFGPRHEVAVHLTSAEPMRLQREASLSTSHHNPPQFADVAPSDAGQAGHLKRAKSSPAPTTLHHNARFSRPHLRGARLARLSGRVDLRRGVLRRGVDQVRSDFEQYGFEISENTQSLAFRFGVGLRDVERVLDRESASAAT